MRRFLSLSVLVLFISFFSNPAKAQRFNDFEGQKGSVLLKDKRVLKGLISFELKKDIVNIKTEDRLFTFEASQVSSFIIRDEDNTRFFESLEIQKKNGYVRSMFFELLFKGDASLYTRLMDAGKSIYRATYLHDFYLLSPKSKYPIDLAERNFRKFDRAFERFESDIYAYRKRFDIDTRNPLHVAKVVEYYNALLDERSENSDSSR